MYTERRARAPEPYPTHCDKLGRLNRLYEPDGLPHLCDPTYTDPTGLLAGGSGPNLAAPTSFADGDLLQHDSLATGVRLLGRRGQRPDALLDRLFMRLYVQSRGPSNLHQPRALLRLVDNCGGPSNPFKLVRELSDPRRYLFQLRPCDQ